ncbi:16S rRNA (cytosine(1402)-N(4))-methyltransferase RsmH [Candidatus Uhrbacteria bacterium]|nr:16S rRNA (cytosine(1402)-N(4))-methyltransferase RsmH [Candidatus Uhrbacteria bacterium]
MKIFSHAPVMLTEVIEGLALRPGLTVLDGTVGLGGHAGAILERIGKNGRLLAIDRDPAQLARAKDRLRGWKNVEWNAGSYKDATRIAYEHGIRNVDCALLDLGFASSHVDDPARGFSFQTEGPLDMRYDPSLSFSAADIINTWSAQDLAMIFSRYGEERHAARLAQAIIARRRAQPFHTTTDIANFIAEQRHSDSRRIHPATHIFQALRIAVNDELGELRAGLPAIWNLLAPGGRLAVISFHSLEDRIVKMFMRERVAKGEGACQPKNAQKPTKEEIRTNPRSRSARLRIIQKYVSTIPQNNATRNSTHLHVDAPA